MCQSAIVTLRIAARASIFALLGKVHRAKNGAKNLINTSQAPHDEVRSPQACDRLVR
jgi:hypothetical protein